LGFSAECLDDFEVHERISRFAIRPQEFVQLCVYGMRQLGAQQIWSD
jgi:hypothetical protein